MVMERIPKTLDYVDGNVNKVANKVAKRVAKKTMNRVWFRKTIFCIWALLYAISR